MRLNLRWVALLGAALALACGEKDGDSAAETGLCATAPVTTWDNFGAGFIAQECQACHASTAEERNGAPEQVTFDDEAQVWAQATAILGVATGDSPRMPPEGGVGEDERYRLEVWLRCDSP